MRCDFFHIGLTIVRNRTIIRKHDFVSKVKARMTHPSKQLRRFNRLISETEAVYHEIAQRLGLSDSAFQILYTLHDEGGACPLRDICILSGLTKQTVNSALRKLEAEGSVMTASSGARHKIVSLTPEGAALAERTVAQVIAIENDILGSWLPDELERYLRLTEDYLVVMRERAKEVHI